MARDYDETDRIELPAPTDRLRAVAVLRRAGWTQLEIARAMGVTLRTIRRYVRQLERIEDHADCLAS